MELQASPPAPPAVDAAGPRRPPGFGWLRLRILRNTVRVTVRDALLRLSIIVVCSALVWGGVFLISHEGFHFLHTSQIPLAGGLVGTIFDLLFLALAVLLVFSSAIILFSSLFSAGEAAFLLTTPARADRVFAYHFQGATLFSSWAFVLLGSPALVAYGLASTAPWYFYGLLLLFFLGFVLLPCSLGALACLLLVNFLPKHRRQVMILAGAVVLVAAFGASVWVYQRLPADWEGNKGRDFLHRVANQLALVQGPLSPNHWMTRGLQAAARDEVGRAGYYLALVWSNGLFLYLVAMWASVRLYRRGFNRLATGGTLRRRYGGHVLDRSLSGVVSFLDPQTRLLIVKDFRMFRRDPAQWAQVLIFTGLMVLYFANMRQFYREDLGRSYQNGVSLMNLAATALLLCAYTGRFIYPMLSLEGRKFWVLGLLPLHRDRLLWGKFAFAATWALVMAEALVVFSDLMLAVPAGVVGLHALTVAVLALGLSGLSVGLGAWMPNFRESDPSKIAVGFGGTLNLIAGLLFLLVVICLMSLPWHLRVAAETAYHSVGGDELEAVAAAHPWGGRAAMLIGAGVTAGIAVGALTVVVPLRLGIRALRRMEF